MESEFSNDKVFDIINRKFITLKDEDVKSMNEKLHGIFLRQYVETMKQDELFRYLFKEILYSGSFYKGTKVGKPDEYDLKICLELPAPFGELQIDTNHNNSGYVKIKVIKHSSSPQKWKEYTHVYSNDFKNYCNFSQTLDLWLTRDNYLDQDKFRQWMEGVIAVAENKIFSRAGFFPTILVVPFKSSKSGPAFTTKFEMVDTSERVSIDLVPCLYFNDLHLSGYRKIKSFWGSKICQEVTVVAKPLTIPNHNVYWRLSIYEQERQILKAVGEVKPVIRMMKKFRDTQNWTSLKSYFIETLFLNEVMGKADDEGFFKRSPKTFLFFHMLEQLRQCFREKRLANFWNKSENLFKKISHAELENLFHRLDSILADMSKKIKTDQLAVARYILTEDELHDLNRALQY